MQLELEYFYINDIVPEFQRNFSSFLTELTFLICHIKCLSFQINCQIKKKKFIIFFGAILWVVS